MPEQYQLVERPAEYVITYYGTGTAPQHKTLDDEAEAIAEFKRMCNDPFKSPTSVERRQTIAVRRYV